jgi:hypothetical protein
MLGAGVWSSLAESGRGWCGEDKFGSDARV